MKKLFTSALLLAFTVSNYCQPSKIFTKLIGGLDADYSYSSGLFNDTLILVTGKTLSQNISTRGSFDALISSFTTEGNLRSLKGYGTNLNDQYNDWIKINDTTAFLVGFGLGTGGDFPMSYGGSDGIVTAFNPIKNRVIWHKNFGGTNSDQIADIVFVEQGRIVIGGVTRSVDKDMPNRTLFGDDAYVGAITESGTKADNLFKVIAGTKNEAVKKLLKSELRTFVMYGDGESNDGDFAGLNNAGGRDIFTIKANQALQLGTKTMIGGPGDDIFVDAVMLSDFSTILFATVNTSGGMVGTLKGGKDIWVLKYNQAGKLLWKKLIGGSKDDEPVRAILANDNNILLIANSTSNDGDFKANYGNNDMNLMKLDTSGKIIWVQNFGGRDTDKGGAVVQDKNNFIYTIGESFSTDRDLTTMNNQAPDLWIQKLFECTTISSQYTPTVCAGDTATINKKKYFIGKSQGVDTLKGASQFKCDSVVQVNVNFKGVSQQFIMDTLCNDESITINNVVFNKSKTSQVFKLKTTDGCDSLLNVLLQFLSPITTKSVNIIPDNGTGNGEIEVIPEGGLPPYTYRWNNGANTNKLINQNAGNLSLTVTDANGCSSGFSFVIKSNVGTSDQNTTSVFWSKEELVIQDNAGIKQIELIGIDGRRIDLIEANSVKEYRLDRKRLKSGFKLIKILNKEGKIQSIKSID